ncbi:MAG: anti-sigma factor, partial [Nocardioides sp.]
VGFAAALVLIGTAGGVGIGRWTAPDVPVVPKEPIALTAATGSPVRVESADLVNHTWGTELRFVAQGFEDGATFRAAFRLSSGDLVPAGEFIGVGSGEMTCNLQSAALREDVTEVLVTDTSGQAVLSSPL